MRVCHWSDWTALTCWWKWTGNDTGIPVRHWVESVDWVWMISSWRFAPQLQLWRIQVRLGVLEAFPIGEHFCSGVPFGSWLGSKNSDILSRQAFGGEWSWCGNPDSIEIRISCRKERSWCWCCRSPLWWKSEENKSIWLNDVTKTVNGFNKIEK